MKVSVVLSLELDYLWGTEEELAEMDDEQVIDLVAEDWALFIDKSSMKVVRESGDLMWRSEGDLLIYDGPGGVRGWRISKDWVAQDLAEFLNRREQ